MRISNFVAQKCLNTAQNYKVVLLLVAIIAVSAFAVSAQQQIWSENDQNRSNIITDKGVARQSFPKSFKLFNLNIAPLRQQLFSIVGDSARGQSTVISLPNVNGSLEYFEVFEASNFEPDLQAQFPEIRAFSGRGITDRYATLKLSISPKGIQTMVFRTGMENEFIEPYSEDHKIYAVFNSSREKGELPWACSTDERDLFSVWKLNLPETDTSSRSNTGELKTMRLAQSVNGEYSNYFGATSAAQVNLVLAAINATLTRSNGVYEKDLGLHLNLIANTTAVIYYDPATDPYTTLSNWNNQLQATLTEHIGDANYDIGHLFGASGGGGNAGCIGCVCSAGIKGRGITSPADGIPQGDNFDIDYVVHEVGHQLGANHTFSHSIEGSGAQNKEVGSGITIMGYAGITSRDVAPHSIDVFHQTSIQQIQNNLAPKPCPVTTVMTANSTPVVAPVSNYTIPITTPFALTGSATDAENDPLTYNWEQNDTASSSTTGANSVASATKLTGPNWLTFPSTASGTRTFPRLSTILAGQSVTGPLPGGDAGANIEALSSVSRTLNFRLTVRDNRPYVPSSTIGQTQFTDMTVTVSNAAGPFRVTTGNAATTWTAGSSQTVTWDVNGTNAAPINTENVKISLSTDGGQTFPNVLAASTANDGTHSVTVPNTLTTQARIKIEAIGNIYFDINDLNFTIAESVPGACRLQRRGDFDGDGTTDFSVFRPSTGAWYVMPNGSGTASGINYGISSDKLQPADYDNDGKTDYAVYRAGIWYWTQSSDNTTKGFAFGASSDIPVAGDYTGDGKADLTVYRPSTGVWYVYNPVNGSVSAKHWGGDATDVPVVGDFDGDCKMDYAVRRTTNSAGATIFYILKSSGGGTSVTFGRNDMALAIGDYNGDGKSDVGVVETRNGLYFWYAISSDGGSLLANNIPFGQTGDVITAGDYNGDGSTDLSVWRSSNGVFYHRTVGNATQFGRAFGATTDTPVARWYQYQLP